MGAAAVPIALAVGSAVVGAVNTARTAKKQDRATAEGIRKQSELQRQANARLNETLKFFEESNAGDIKTSLSDRYGKQLRLKQAQALAGLSTAGDSSDAFKARAAAAGTSAVDKGNFFKDVFASVDAPVDQRQLEGFNRNDLGIDLSVTGRNSAAEDYLTKLRLAGIRRNPLLDILSAGLSGAASGTSGGFGGGKTLAGLSSVNPSISAASGASFPNQVFFPPQNPSKFGSIFKI